MTNLKNPQPDVIGAVWFCECFIPFDNCKTFFMKFIIALVFFQP